MPNKRVIVDVVDLEHALLELQEDIALGEDNQIVCAIKITRSCNGYISPKLWPLMMDEFSKNGKKMLSIGKVRFLRRRVRKLR